MKNYAGAIEDYSETLKLEPESARFYYNRGLARLAAKAYDQAIADFNETLRIEPSNAGAKDALLRANRAQMFRR